MLRRFECLVRDGGRGIGVASAEVWACCGRAQADQALKKLTGKQYFLQNDTRVEAEGGEVGRALNHSNIFTAHTSKEPNEYFTNDTFPFNRYYLKEHVKGAAC